MQNRINQRVRRSVRSRRNADNVTLDDVNVIINLNNRLKIGRNLIPPNFLSHDLGEMNLRCTFCDAKHFSLEITNRDRDRYTLCCGKGKIDLPALTQNIFSDVCMRI